MGLDMHLVGVKHMNRYSTTPEVEDHYPIRAKELDLGYWRKHPDLHGYIVQNFGGGVDECQRIPLDAHQLRQLLSASEADALPTTTGFFFGTSSPEDKEHTRRVLERALGWVEEKDDYAKSWREVYYQASW